MDLSLTSYERATKQRQGAPILEISPLTQQQDLGLVTPLASRGPESVLSPTPNFWLAGKPVEVPGEWLDGYAKCQAEVARFLV